MSLQCGLEGEATAVMSEIFRGLESRHVLMLPWPLHHITQSIAEYCKRCACSSTLSKRCLVAYRVANIWACNLQEGSKGGMRKELGSLDDAGHAVPTASGVSSDSEPLSSRGSAAPQSLAAGPEGRSSSIGEVSCPPPCMPFALNTVLQPSKSGPGHLLLIRYCSLMCLELLAAMQELKRVMKSERAGRLARDSAEILVGDRPGEFTVVTQEGSSIPVDVRDLAESASLKMDPSGDSGAADTEPKASDALAHRAAEQPASASAEAAAPSAADQLQQPEQPVPEQPASAARKTTWLGSMMAAGTAALGLKGGSPGDAGSASAAQSAARSIPQQAASTGPTADSAAPTAGPQAAAAGEQAEPPVLNIAARRSQG